MAEPIDNGASKDQGTPETVSSNMIRQNHRPGGGFAPGHTLGKRFEKGHPYIGSNPYIKRKARLRAALFRVCDPAEMEKAILVLIKQAQGGDRAAFSELWDRLMGKPIPENGESEQQAAPVTNIFVGDKPASKAEELRDWYAARSTRGNGEVK